VNNLQGSEDWFSARIGKITSSRVSDVMAKGRGNEPSASRKNYMAQLLCERLTGQREETYTNAIMQRGIDLEPLAKSAYEIETGLLVQDVGFIVHPQLDYTGTSPDCLVFGNGVGEVAPRILPLCNQARLTRNTTGNSSIKCGVRSATGTILLALMTGYRKGSSSLSAAYRATKRTLNKWQTQ